MMRLAFYLLLVVCVCASNPPKIQFWSFSVNNSQTDYTGYANDLGGIVDGITSCCEQGDYCFNVTGDYFPTTFTAYELIAQTTYVTAIMPALTFSAEKYQLSAMFSMYGNRPSTCFNPQSVSCPFGSWCTFPCYNSGGFNISVWVNVAQEPEPAHELVSTPIHDSPTAIGGKAVSGEQDVSYWGVWVDADLFYNAFTNSLAESLACAAPSCASGDYCFNVTNGDGVPTDFQIFAVFQNQTIEFYDTYDLSVRLSSSRYKLVVTLNSNYTTTDCPLQSDEGATTTCNYGNTCQASCNNGVNLGFTLSQPMALDILRKYPEHQYVF